MPQSQAPYANRGNNPASKLAKAPAQATPTAAAATTPKRVDSDARSTSAAPPLAAKRKLAQRTRRDGAASRGIAILKIESPTASRTPPRNTHLSKPGNTRGSEGAVSTGRGRAWPAPTANVVVPATGCPSSDNTRQSTV